MISADDAQRLGVLAARLQSGQDGQVIQAARALVAELNAHGLRIGDLIADVLRPRPSRIGVGDATHVRIAKAALACPWHFSVVDLQFLFDVTHLPKLTSRQEIRMERLASRLDR